MARWPEEDGKSSVKEGLLWPAIRDHFFYLDAVTHDSQRVEIGDNEFACVDLAVGPEDVRPFVELASRLGQDRIPWRVSLVLEGGGNSAMMLKQIGASFLSMFPANRDLQRAFASLRHAREEDNHIAVTLRASFATWAPLGETRKLRRRASTLSQRIEAWGNCRATPVVGDPLEGVMSSVPVCRWGPRRRHRSRCSATRWRCCRGIGPRRHGAGSVLFRQPNGRCGPTIHRVGRSGRKCSIFLWRRRVRASRFWRIRSISASVLARPYLERMVRKSH